MGTGLVHNDLYCFITNRTIETLRNMGGIHPLGYIQESMKVVCQK